MRYMTADVSHFFYSSPGLRANEIGGSITAKESHLGGSVGRGVGGGGLDWVVEGCASENEGANY